MKHARDASLLRFGQYVTVAAMLDPAIGAAGRSGQQDELRPGSVLLGRYRLLRLLGTGGMGNVWAASAHGARGFQRTVALKVLERGLRDDPRYGAMLLEEARVAARIQHPNVVPVLDVGEHEGCLFAVLEMVEGEDLRAVMAAARSRGVRIEPELAARIVVDACAGLHAAHDLSDDGGAPLGLVHRDVSPPNLLLSMSGQVRLSDFGIVRTGQGVDTSPGQVKGRVRYMAPEQALGQRIDRRADVFSMGVVLYELWTGAHPFDGAGEVQMLSALLSGSFRDAADARPDLPAPMAQVLGRALAPLPEARFPSAAALGAAIADAVGARLATSEAVAAFMHETVGQQVAARAAALRDALRDGRRWRRGRRPGRPRRQRSRLRHFRGAVALALAGTPAASPITSVPGSHATIAGVGGNERSTVAPRSRHLRWLAVAAALGALAGLAALRGTASAEPSGEAASGVASAAARLTPTLPVPEPAVPDEQADARPSTPPARGGRRGRPPPPAAAWKQPVAQPGF
ncbi:MAG: serine/threonine-protein kinase [Polyangiaceae bacterium]